MTDAEIETLRREIGARARKRREELGISVAQVADYLGSTRQSVYAMELLAPSTLRVLIEWATELDLSPAELMFGSKEDLLKEAASLIDGRFGKRKELVSRIKNYLKMG